MNFPMTFLTYRYNIKPMLLGIAFVMMILFCLCGAVMALQRIGAGQSSGFDGMVYLVRWFIPFGMLDAKTFLDNSSGGFAFFALGISLIYIFPFFALSINPLIYVLAYSAIASKAIFCRAIFVKFRKRFNLFAFPTSFCYDLLRHNRFLNKRLCLEPVARYALAVGLFYDN